MEDFIITIVALFLLIVPPIDYIVAYLLYRASKKTHSVGGIALRERATVALFLAAATTINAVLALLRLTNTRVPSEVGITLLLTSLVLVTLPNIVWIITYIKARGLLKREKRDANVGDTS